MNQAIDQLTENNPNPMLNVKKDGTVLYANEASKSLLNEWSVGVGEKLPSSIIDFVQRAISQSPEKIEVNVGKRVYSLAFHPVPEEECVNVYGFDISDQKELEEIKLRKIEEKYRKGEEQYSALFNARTNAIAHCRVVTNEKGKTIDYIVLKVNDAYEEVTGIKKKDIEGRKITEVFPGIECFAYDYIGNFGRVAFEGTELEVEVFLEPLQQWLSIYVYSSIYGEFTAIFTDITERKQANEALRESEERYRSHFNTAAVGTTEIDLTGRFIQVNDRYCQITGYSRDELLGMNITELSHPDDRDYDRKLLADYLNGGTPTFNVEKRYVRKDSKVIWIQITAAMICDSEGRPLRSTGVVQDITKRKKTEEALRESEAKFKVFLENSSIIAWMKDEEGHHTFLSGNYEKRFGVRFEDWCGKTDFELWPREIAEEFRENDLEVMKGGKHVEVIEEARNPDGSTSWWLNCKFPFVDSSGKKCVGGLGVDITERKQAENALQESEERFRTLAENSPDVIARFDRHNRHLYANPAATLPYGHSQKEIIGKTHSELGMDPEKVKFWEGHHENVFATGKPETMEFQYKSPQGKEFYFNTRIVPEFADGEVTYVLAISRDITDIKEAGAKLKETLNNLEKLVEERTSQLKKAYNSLKESEQRLQSIVNGSPGIIFIKDLKGRFILINKSLEELLGITRDETRGKTDFDIFSPELAEYYQMHDRKVLETGLPEQMEEVADLVDGRHIFLANKFPLYDMQGKTYAICGISTDITEYKKAEEAMAKIEIVRKQEIHHRIKNNLQVISSLLDLQAETFRDQECIKDSEVLKAFRESQNRVISMALIHEELYKGGGLETLNFAPYIEKLAESLFQTYSIGNTDISLNMDLMENTFFDMDTAIPLGMIVNELVSNSLKHAFKGRDMGEVRIKLHREESEDRKSSSYVLNISDDGVGIPEDLEIEDLDSLGMQLVITLVDQLDGELELKRDNGTEFTVRFAITEKDNQASAPSP